MATILGCASGAPPAAPPRPLAESGPVISSLEPSAAELRAAASAALSGDEWGRLWTFDNPPTDRWKREYGFAPDAAWLEKVRLASLRYGEYCSAAFVSSDGLAVTNQHCARECIEAVSPGGADWVANGFVAQRRSQERECPGLYVDQLVATEDVTDRVLSGVNARPTDAEAMERAIIEASLAVEDECEAGRMAVRCQVVPLWGGAVLMLHRYHRYSTVKLVFAPELRAAYFGGEHDNFTYPRHALDVSFVRVYDGDSPVEPEAWLPFDPDGAAEGETVFVTGNPGSTSRMFTVAQLLYDRTYRLPLRIWVLEQQRRTMETALVAEPSLESQIRQDMFEVSNSLKAYTGMLAGLRDTLLVGAKIRQEADLRAAVAADRYLSAAFGDAWDRLAELQRRKLDISPRLNATNMSLIGSPHFEMAWTLAELIRQMALPEEERGPRFRGEAGVRLRESLESDLPIDEAIAWQTLTAQLRFLGTWVPADHPLRRLLLRPDDTVDEAAKRLIEETSILDPWFRRQLLDGGTPALEASDDPLIVYARRALAEDERLWAEWQAVTAAEAVQRRRLGRAVHAIYGDDVPPDATFTLRIADGVVKRYAWNGTIAPSNTTFHGMFARSAAFGGEEPWKLPAAFEKARSRIDMDAPLDFVATTDITGGNSGSPVIGTDGRLVGVVFDSNMELLPNAYLFRSDAGRTVAVHSAGILEALRSVYNADALVTELTARNRGR